MRTHFIHELDRLNSDLLEMGALAEHAIGEAIDALVGGDAEKARLTMEADPAVDDKEKEVERRCFKLLLQQQPVAADLRLVSTALKMVTDLERIGDQARDIAEIALRLINDNYRGRPRHIPEMAQSAREMVKDAIDAYVAKDLEGAKIVIGHDDIVDRLFLRVRDEVIEIICSDADAGEYAVDLLMVAKYLERIGDHATNIAGWVIFSITGEHGHKRVL